MYTKGIDTFNCITKTLYSGYHENDWKNWHYQPSISLDFFISLTFLPVIPQTQKKAKNCATVSKLVQAIEQKPHNKHTRPILPLGFHWEYHHVNRLILVSIGLRHMWHTFRDSAHLEHALWPHKKATFHLFSIHIWHVRDSSNFSSFCWSSRSRLASKMLTFWVEISSPSEKCHYLLELSIESHNFAIFSTKVSQKMQRSTRNKVILVSSD